MTCADFSMRSRAATRLHSRKSSEGRSGRIGCGSFFRIRWIVGISPASQRYAIRSVAEAEAYLNDPVLGRRLVECAEALLSVEGRSAQQIFGSPDDMKLKSSVTLFAHISPPGSVFERVLDKYFRGERDGNTLRLLD